MHPQTLIAHRPGLPPLADAFPGLLFIADAQGLGTYSNVRFQEYAGRSAEALAGNGWLGVLHPDDRARADAAWREAVAAGARFEGEFRLRHRDGRHLWHLCRAEAVRDGRGRIAEWVGTCIDIDARRRREDTLQQSQDLLGRMFAASRDALTVSSLTDHVVQEVNESFLRLFALESGELVGRSQLGLQCIMDPAHRDQVLTMLARDGRVDDLEIQLSRRGGERLAVLLSVEPVELRGQRLLLTTIRDVTARTLMEEDLRQERELLQTIIDKIPVMITVYDPETDAVRVNAEFERLIGWPAQNTSLSELMEACYPDPDYRTGIMDFMRANPEHWMDMRMRTQAGGELETAWANVALSGGTQVGIGIDISDRKRAERALRESARRKDQFLAVLAHELRNPLAPLRTGLELLELSGITDPTVVHVRTMMQRQLAHVVHLVDDLMDVSRVRRGKIELQRSTVDLRDVLEAAVEQTRPLLDEHGHRLVVEEPDEVLPVEGDPERLTQVVGNLLSNAAKYTSPGGTVTLRAAREGDEGVLQVQDTGMGIPKHRLCELFDMFAQIPEHQAHSGSGLGIGLALSRQLVELHGGRIEAASEGPGQGSVFTVHLPLQAPGLPAQADAGPPRP